MTEHLKWQYQARSKQMEKILEQVDGDFKTEMEGLTNSEYHQLLATSPISLNRLIKLRGLERDEFFQKAAEGAKYAVKLSKARESLEDLQKTIQDTPHTTRELLIDLVDTTIYPEIATAFSDYPNLISSIMEEGKELGIGRVLDILKGEVPLLRYRRDLAKMKLKLIPAIDGGLLGFIPTKVPNVDLKFWYPGEEQLPKLSLLVKSFEN